MQRFRFVLPVYLVAMLCVFSGAAHAAESQPAEKPWDSALIARLPEAYREIAARLADATESSFKFMRAGNEARVFGVLAHELSGKPEGLKFLIQMTQQDASADRRSVIVERLGRVAHQDAALTALIEELAVSDPAAKVSLAALDALERNQRHELEPLLDRRLELAKKLSDIDGIGDLRMKQADYIFGITTLPAFVYRAPEVFSVAPASAQQVRVLAFGDFGSGAEDQLQSAAAMRAYHKNKPFTFGITVGDNFYPRGLDTPQSPRWRSEWENPYGPMGIKFYATYGNHDYLFPDSPAAELAYAKESKSWVFPAPFYTFTAGAAQFFAIDTVRLSKEQLHWLQQALAASTARWKIVYGHYQIYSATRGDDEDLTMRLLPVLKRGGVDVYLCGHDHNMQELKPEGSLHFFVVGAGGVSLHEMKTDYPCSLYQGFEYGFGEVTIEPQALTVSLVGLDGKVLHERKITDISHEN